ncbi:hypothetical protein PLICRDRAFT_51839 [Plicaturopsis crispa FD-325 SS-3]|nr:hypothetical protein PLICRDRAFT_51839 [Plicaturopsis crispa FD-325 SS-3]
MNTNGFQQHQPYQQHSQHQSHTPNPGLGQGQMTGSINPAMLAAFQQKLQYGGGGIGGVGMGGMGGGGGSGVNPAMLMNGGGMPPQPQHNNVNAQQQNTHQHQQQGSLNPQQLLQQHALSQMGGVGGMGGGMGNMGGGGGMGLNINMGMGGGLNGMNGASGSSMNGAMNGAMNGGMNGGMNGMSMNNPAINSARAMSNPLAHANPSPHPNPAHLMSNPIPSGSPHPMSNSSPHPMSNPPQHQNPLQFPGQITREQVAQMSPADRQLLHTKMLAYQQQQQQQQQGFPGGRNPQQQPPPQGYYERPSSSASSSSHPMAPPSQPPSFPRPPSAADMGFSQQQFPKQASPPRGAKRKAAPMPDPTGMMGPPILPRQMSSQPSMSSPRPSTVDPVQIPPSPRRAAPVLPPLPSNVNLNPLTTRVSVVPLAESETAIPPLSADEIAEIKSWKERDQEYEGVFKRMKIRMGAELQERGAPGKAAWWEKDVIPTRRMGRPEPFDVKYPRNRKEKDGKERKKAGRREGMRIPRKLDPEDANRPEQLVPIRLEFDVEHHKMRDTFVWNLNDPVVTPESFAQSVVDDYNLMPSYHSVITKSIQDQLSDFRAHSASIIDVDGTDADAEDNGVAGKGLLDDADAAWWESWRRRLRSEEASARAARRADKTGKKRRRVVVKDEQLTGQESDLEKPMAVDDFDVDEKSLRDDMRILVKLDIIVGSMKLDDQFEWDIESAAVSPEQFATTYANELGLGGEFRTAIAHAIREQVQTYQKSLFLVGHPSDGSVVQDDELRTSFLPSLSSGSRALDEVQSFTPLLNYLSDGEIERSEKEREKDMNKRRKRNTRGRRGIALPDREPIRTYRTPAIGFPELDPAALALAVAATAPTSRRAAAAAASLTIANMVASENGQVYPQQSMQTTSQPTAASKEKKTKGHFKAPPYPPSVLRPRAHVTAPTPSTAMDASMSIPLDDSLANAPPDSKAQRVITARRAKELEREAKEKEYAEGQHANMIDGVWHCSNCGAPESVAVGRRKGPLGDKSQCGPCGKYWHRHRRPYPIEWNTDPAFHTSYKRDPEAGVRSQAKKKGAAALRAQGATAASTPIEGTVEPETPTRRKSSEVYVDVPPRPSSPSRPVSPALSSASSGSEPPLAQQIKMNGIHSDSPPPSKSDPAPSAEQNRPEAQSGAPASTNGSSTQPPPKHNAPEWLQTAKEEMEAKWPDDRFELFARKVAGSDVPEWRIKCLDCPGKLYTPGPGETLSNYEVHMKNRQHRNRVNTRKGTVDP